MMSPSGDVVIRLVNPLPALVVKVPTMFAANRRSVGLVVVTDPLLLVVLLPLVPVVASTGLFGSAPLYSTIRISGYCAATENVTTTVFAPPLAAAIFLA